jgi:hypothetical protein
VSLDSVRIPVQAWIQTPAVGEISKWEQAELDAVTKHVVPFAGGL